jgi:hypothetical protein
MRYFCSPMRPDLLPGHFILLFKGTDDSFPKRQPAEDVKLTTHINLVSRLRMRGAIPTLPHMPSRRGA